MDPNKKDIDELQAASYSEVDGDALESVDDFIKQLEEKEKDLHITAETSVIEIAEAFDETEELPGFIKESLAASAKSQKSTPAGHRDDAKVKTLESELTSLKGKIAKLQADRDEMLESSQRRAKDVEAFKARSERERRETFQNQIGNIATLMLPALDNLHRALDSAEQLSDKTPTFQDFFDGIALVSEQINDILNKMGIKPIRTVGEEFDPHYHEAVATEETDAFAPNTVCEEILRGYIAGERVIRHSLVKVAKSPPPAAPDDAPTEDDA